MTHRIQLDDAPAALRIDFQGVLDRAALAVITATLRRSAGRHVTLVLGEGTEVDPECIDPLRRLEGVEVRAASAFLARWLRGDGQR